MNKVNEKHYARKFIFWILVVIYSIIVFLILSKTNSMAYFNFNNWWYIYYNTKLFFVIFIVYCIWSIIWNYVWWKWINWNTYKFIYFLFYYFCLLPIIPEKNSWFFINILRLLFGASPTVLYVIRRYIRDFIVSLWPIRMIAKKIDLKFWNCPLCWVGIEKSPKYFCIVCWHHIDNLHWSAIIKRWTCEKCLHKYRKMLRYPVFCPHCGVKLRRSWKKSI